MPLEACFKTSITARGLREPHEAASYPANRLIIHPCVSADLFVPCEKSRSCVSRYEQLSGTWCLEYVLATRQTSIYTPAVRASNKVLLGQQTQSQHGYIIIAVTGDGSDIWWHHCPPNGGPNTGLCMYPYSWLAPGVFASIADKGGWLTRDLYIPQQSEPATRYLSDSRLSLKHVNHHCGGWGWLRGTVHHHCPRNGGPNTGLCMCSCLPACSRTLSRPLKFDSADRRPIYSPAVRASNKVLVGQQTRIVH